MTHIFKMPLGLLKDGNIIRDVELDGMTAKIRKDLAKPKYRKNSGEFLTFLLKECVRKIGDEEPSVHEINSLTSGDRDYLLLMIRKISLGDTITFRIVCGNASCGQNLEIALDIDNDIEIKTLSKRDYKIQDDRYIVHLKNKRLSIDCKMMLPNGYDQIRIAPISNRNPIEANYKMYEYCMVEYNGKKDGFDSKFVENLPVRVCDWIDLEFRRLQPGPDWTQRLPCEVCGWENSLSLENSDFLFSNMA